MGMAMHLDMDMDDDYLLAIKQLVLRPLWVAKTELS